MSPRRQIRPLLHDAFDPEVNIRKSLEERLGQGLEIRITRRKCSPSVLLEEGPDIEVIYTILPVNEMKRSALAESDAKHAVPVDRAQLRLAPEQILSVGPRDIGELPEIGLRDPP